MTCMTASDAQAVMTAYEQWYDSKDADTQELIDEIHESTSFIIDEDEYDAFIDELKDEGITTAEEFCDRFRGEWDGVGDHVTTKFTEELCEEVYPTDDLPDIYRFAIDFELVWYQSLRYDFYDMEFKGRTYFFYRH
jgi:PDZ domain-containing secreted protein